MTVLELDFLLLRGSQASLFVNFWMGSKASQVFILLFFDFAAIPNYDNLRVSHTPQISKHYSDLLRAVHCLGAELTVA